MSIVIGVDPDSEKHGVAVYEDKKLVTLVSLSLVEFVDLLKDYIDKNPVVHIENVCGNNAVFSKPGLNNARIVASAARRIGKCQQAQVELQRFCDAMMVKVVRHKISKKWKKADKGQFKRLTGWTGRSNEDTRSAAWFGYLGINAKN